MKHACLAMLALLYWPIVGRGRTWAATAVMLTAIAADWRRVHGSPAADR